MFEGLSDKLKKAMKTISGKSKLTESNITCLLYTSDAADE